MAGTYRYRIESRDIDASLRVRLYSMGDLILQAAGDDADMLGFGVSDLNLDNASWVLSRMAVEMRRMPLRHDQIDIYTWVSDYGRLMTTRNMVVTDAEGIEIGASVTQWAMIDLSTRRPLDLSALSNKSTSLVDREPPIERPRRIGAFQPSEERLYNVVYSDIDFNGHVNSMKYLEWMVDAIPAGALAEMTGGAGLRFDINYLHEAKQGDALTVCRGTDGAGAFLFDIRGEEGSSVCKAAIT